MLRQVVVVGIVFICGKNRNFAALKIADIHNMQEKIIILDFGSQTTQLIGRRVRELNTYCEIVPYNKFPYDDNSVIGVILSGSPFSVYDEKAFRLNLSDIPAEMPVLGICYGAQFMAYENGGNVEPAGSREYGRAKLSFVNSNDPLLAWVDDFLVGLHHKLKPVFGILLPSAGYIHFHPLHDGQVVAYNGNTVQLVSLAVQHSLTGRIERHGVAAVLGVLNTLGVD